MGKTKLDLISLYERMLNGIRMRNASQGLDAITLRGTIISDPNSNLTYTNNTITTIPYFGITNDTIVAISPLHLPSANDLSAVEVEGSWAAISYSPNDQSVARVL